MKDSKVGKEAVIVSNGASLEESIVELEGVIRDPEDVFCLNQAGWQLNECGINKWKNLVVIHPEECVWERSIKPLADMTGKILYASTVVAHKAVSDCLDKGGSIKLFSTGKDGPKAIPATLGAFPMLGAGITVAYSALGILKYLGYTKVNIFGLDFSYINYKKYAWQEFSYEELKNSGLELVETSKRNPVLTDVTLLKSLESCKSIIKNNPDIKYLVYGDNLLYDDNMENLARK